MARQKVITMQIPQSVIDQIKKVYPSYETADVTNELENLIEDHLYTEFSVRNLAFVYIAEVEV